MCVGAFVRPRLPSLRVGPQPRDQAPVTLFVRGRLRSQQWEQTLLINGRLPPTRRLHTVAPTSLVRSWLLPQGTLSDYPGFEPREPSGFPRSQIRPDWVDPPQYFPVAPLAEPELSRARPQIPRNSPTGWKFADRPAHALVAPTAADFAGVLFLTFFSHGLIFAPSGTSPSSRYRQSAISNLRASATIPTFRSRALPEPNRR
jgi:hypothetical protein